MRYAWILTPTTRFATTLSTTTTPAATAPPLPLVHLGISALAFKSNWHEFRWRVRNESETSWHLFPPPSLSLSLSLFPALSLSSLALLLELLLLFLLLLLLLPLLTTTTTNAVLLVLLVLLVYWWWLLWVFRTVSGPRAYFVPKFEIECVHAWILII